jgi:hypothetical protein
MPSSLTESSTLFKLRSILFFVKLLSCVTLLTDGSCRSDFDLIRVFDFKFGIVVNASTGMHFGISLQFKKGWFCICFTVNRCFGSLIRILLMKSFASSGTFIFYFIERTYWKFVITAFNFSIHHFYFIGLEWQSTKQKTIANNPN